MDHDRRGLEDDQLAVDQDWDAARRVEREVVLGSCARWLRGSTSTSSYGTPSSSSTTCGVRLALPG
jgi:hypothetical protein